MRLRARVVRLTRCAPIFCVRCSSSGCRERRLCMHGFIILSRIKSPYNTKLAREQPNTLWSRRGAPVASDTSVPAKVRLRAGPVVTGPRAPCNTDRDPVVGLGLPSARGGHARPGAAPDATRRGPRVLDSVVRLGAARLLGGYPRRRRPTRRSRRPRRPTSRDRRLPVRDALCKLLMARGLTYVAADKAARHLLHVQSRPGRLAAELWR